MPDLDLKKWAEAAKGLFGKDLKLKLIVVLGLAGMALILLSQLQSKPDDSPAPDGKLPAQAAGALYSAEEYTAKLEDRLSALVKDISGVGRARVMVTLENSGEYVYVKEEKRSVDQNTEPGVDGNAGKTNSKEDVQQNYILIDTGYGQKEALVKTYIEPKIQGVIIVCEGANSIKVRQSLINVVTTALNIPTTKVCVEKIT